MQDCRVASLNTGLVYYQTSNAMQYSNTVLETTKLVMCDPNTFFYVVSLFIMALQFHEHT